MDYARGGPVTIEANLRALLDRFGPVAVYGGSLPLLLLRRLMVSEAIEQAAMEYKSAENGAGWAEANPRKFGLLAEAEKELKALKKAPK